jgi:hypothetical protein
MHLTVINERSLTIGKRGYYKMGYDSLIKAFYYYDKETLLSLFTIEDEELFTICIDTL